MSATGRSASAGTGHVRHPDDFYRTPEWCVRAIVRHIEIPEGATVLDPACGDGAILDVIQDIRPDVRTVGIELDPSRAAIASRRHGIIGGADALALSALWWAADVVVMNPPFSLAMEFIERAIANAKLTICLQRLSWMSGQKRTAFWRRHPADAYILPRRPSFTGKGTDAADYAWYAWGEGLGGRWFVLDLQEAA